MVKRVQRDPTTGYAIDDEDEKTPLLTWVGLGLICAGIMGTIFMFVEWVPHQVSIAPNNSEYTRIESDDELLLRWKSDYEKLEVEIFYLGKDPDSKGIILEKKNQQHFLLDQIRSKAITMRVGDLPVTVMIFLNEYSFD